MTVPLEELRRLLEAATPGEWVSNFAHWGRYQINHYRKDRTSINIGETASYSQPAYKKYGEANAALICTMKNALPGLLADAELGRILMKYIDRLNDYCEIDPVDKIIKELDADVCASINAALALGRERGD